MTKTKKFTRQFINGGRGLLLLALAVGIVGGTATVGHADQYQEKINALEAENNNKRNNVNSLLQQAGSYQAAIDTIQAQINGLQASLNANLAQQSALQSKITEAQTKLDQQKQHLGENIKTMYIDGQLTTIEQLATSKDLSDYVDREEYRTGVQNKIDATIKEITTLQAQLKKQKAEMDVLVNTQQQQNAELGNARGQQQQLLSYNQGERDSYNAQIGSNNSRIDELRRQQVAANQRFIGGGSSAPGTGPTCGGGYPAKWCNIPMDSVLDDWGMYNRECVSYTAWKVAASGRYMPGWGWQARGNANQWDDNARNAGIPVDGNPRPGDVAISNAGSFGHAMYVESVNANGTINISQYNAAWDGRYSTKTISPGGLYFIHF